MNNIEEAKKLAIEKLSYKKYYIDGKEKPYYFHCFIVADILKTDKKLNDLNFGLTVAYLHDILEDTEVTYDELVKNFGKEVADAVQSLSKNPALPREEQMNDSLNRILSQRQEVASVKLADRICNLRFKDINWTLDKTSRYLTESIMIYARLKDKNKHLANILEQEITNYKKYIRSKIKMMYFKIEEKIYAFNQDSGLTLEFNDGKWTHSNKNIFDIGRNENAVQLVEKEVYKFTNGVLPEEFIENYGKDLS